MTTAERGSIDVPLTVDALGLVSIYICMILDNLEVYSASTLVYFASDAVYVCTWILSVTRGQCT